MYWQFFRLTFSDYRVHRLKTIRLLSLGTMTKNKHEALRSLSQSHRQFTQDFWIECGFLWKMSGLIWISAYLMSTCCNLIIVLLPLSVLVLVWSDGAAASTRRTPWLWKQTDEERMKSQLVVFCFTAVIVWERCWLWHVRKYVWMRPPAAWRKQKLCSSIALFVLLALVGVQFWEHAANVPSESDQTLGVRQTQGTHLISLHKRVTVLLTHELSVSELAGSISSVWQPEKSFCLLTSTLSSPILFSLPPPCSLCVLSCSLRIDSAYHSILLLICVNDYSPTICSSDPHLQLTDSCEAKLQLYGYVSCMCVFLVTCSPYSYPYIGSQE